MNKRKNIFIIILLYGFIFTMNTFSQEIKTLKVLNGKVRTITFSSNNQWMYTASSDDKIIKWNANTFEAEQTFNYDLPEVNGITLSNKGEMVFCSHDETNSKREYFDQSGYYVYESLKPTFSVLNTSNGSVSTPLKIYNELYNMELSSDGNFGYICEYIIENRTSDIIEYLIIHKYDIKESKSNDYRIDLASENRSSVNEKPSKMFFPAYTKIMNNYLIALPNCDWYMSWYNQLIIINLLDNKLEKILVDKHRLDNRLISPCIALSPDGKHIAAGNYSTDDWIYEWDITSGKIVKSFKGHDKDVLCLAYSPDGNYLASGSKDNSIRLWDMKTKKIIKVLKGHKDNVNSIVFSPDGKYIVSGSDDETIKVWDILDLLPALKTYSANYDIEYGIRFRLQEEFDKEVQVYNDYFKPKGEFETTDEYDARVKEGNKLVKELFQKYKDKIEELKNVKILELSTINDQTVNEKAKKIEASIKDTTVEITSISSYNADKQIYIITIKGYTNEVNIPLNEASSFKDNWKKALVKCKMRLMEDLNSWQYYNFIIIHPITRNEYLFGDQY